MNAYISSQKINSKKQLIEALKNGQKLTFVTIQNNMKPDLIGLERKPGTKQQTNAFTLKTPKNGGFVDSWIWYNEIDVKENIIRYKDFDIQLQIIVN